MSRFATMTPNQSAAGGECLPPGWLVGTWEFTHTTAPASFPFEIVYHFDRSGIHYWEMPLDRALSRKLVFRRPYREQIDGFWNHWKNASHFFRCQPSFDEVLSVGCDGNLWWMRRLVAPTPDLRYFVDPESGVLVELADPKSER